MPVFTLRAVCIHIVCIILIAATQVDAQRRPAPLILRGKGGQNSSSLIERAHGKGEITLDQWALYQTYALVAPGKLPPAYRSNASTKCGTWVLTQLLSQWDNLTSQTQAALTALNVRAPGVLAAPTLSGFVVSTLHFTIHYSISPADTNAVPAYDGDANGIPDYIDTVMTILEQVWAREVGTMGYFPPPPDGLDGGNSNYDVYVFKLASNLYGYASPYAIVGDNPNSPNVEIDAYRSYLALRNDYSGFPGTTLEALEVTAAHEFFHAIQFGYNARERPWLMEATGAWVEDEVYDSVNDNYQYLDEWFQRPDVPLDAANNTADTLISYPDHWYGSWIYFRHLSEHVGVGPQIVQLIWNFSATHESRAVDRSSQSIAEALASVGGRTLNGVFGSFTAANLLVKNNGYGYSEGAYYPSIARTPIVRDITILDALPRRSSRYYTFDKSQLPSCDEVFSITFTSQDPATNFGLQSVVYSEGSPSVDRMGNTYTVSTPPSWDSLAVIVMNMDNTGSTNRYQMVVEHHPKEGHYTITDIGNAGGGGPTLVINQRGQVAGTQYVNNGGFQSNYAFLWSDGQIRIIGGDGSTALGINDSGIVVGMVKVPGRVHAYRWSSAGGEDLDKTIYSFSRAWGVNDSGDVVGDATFVVDGNQLVMPALWKHGQTTALPFPPDTLAFTGVARSINNNGVVAGEVTFHRAGEPSSIGALRGVLWTGGSPSELDDTFDPQQINEQGRMAGSATYSYVDNGLTLSTSHAASYLSGLSDLGTLDHLIGLSIAYGINTSGDVVGSSVSAGGGRGAFLFKSGTMVDLNQEIRNVTGGECWTLGSATGINDVGQIVGYGVKNTAPYETHVYLLTPVGATAIKQTPPMLPIVYALFQNYPNPFNPTTVVSYQLPVISDVKLVVYDILGREVATLVNAVEEPGYKSVEWNASGVASGVYFYRLQAGDFVQTRKLLLLR